MMKNIPKPCFNCNETIFINPDIRKPDNPNQLLALDKAFDGTGQIVPHICAGRKPKPNNDYQDRNQWEDFRDKEKEKEKEKEPGEKEATNSENLRYFKTVTKIQYDVEAIKKDMVTVKELLEAVLKSSGMMFQPASQSYPRKIDSTDATSH